ncbi:MAG TPA: pitrilysin family protein [Spirochaetota bacterium]|nr:pitrilysin family protein [Spirochaetota bacterium]HOM38145.1 pitrilysin family protein [Spirochaetota bacterium]HPQ48637.1 pitrilysin family protein [Spirochaetota bacterium]
MKKPLIFRAKNNLICILNPISRAKSFSCGILVGSGSFTEKPDTIGFSHFVEHMVFKGTKTRTYKEINKEIEKYGGYLNAFTDRNYTLFYTKIIPQFYKKSLEILLDIIFNPVFPEDEIKKEIKVVLEEIAMYEDSPDDNIVDLLFESSYPDSYLGWPILGKPERISSIKRDEIVNYWQSFYYNSNMIISAAGNFDVNEFLSIVENIEGRENKKEEKGNPNTIFKANNSYKLKDVEQLHIGLGKETINIYSEEKEKYSLSLLNSILGGQLIFKIVF